MGIDGLHRGAEIMLDVPATAEPQFVLLERALWEPLAASRLITGDLARAVAALLRRLGE
mgnify:CR=1 FL=1